MRPEEFIGQYRVKFRNKLCSLLFGMLLLGCAFPLCQGALVINVGNFTLLPTPPGQVVEVLVQNTGATAVQVIGLNLNVQVAVSGPAPGLGSIPVPLITAVDILTGTVFQSN